MALFVSSAWGFDPERWSALGFTKEGVRTKLQAEWREGDRMLIIGTKGDETAPNQRGKLLGIVDVTRRATDSWRLVHPDLIAEHEKRGSRGKWSFGMPYRSAERFDEPLPSVEEVLPRIYSDKLGMSAASGYFALSEEEEEAVLLRSRHAANVYVSEEAKRLHSDDAWRQQLRSLSRGPRPTSRGYEVSRSSGPASVYALRFEGTIAPLLGISSVQLGTRSLWKVGWAFDPARRTRVINNHLPSPDVMGWRLKHEQRLPSAIHAYAVEQKILSALRRDAHRGEMVICSDHTLAASFYSALGKPPTSHDLEQARSSLKTEVIFFEDDTI